MGDIQIMNAFKINLEIYRERSLNYTNMSAFVQFVLHT